jgi:hypothetical protein
VQAAAAAAAPDADAGNAVPKRKRSQPVRSSSQKTLKLEGAAVPAA